MKLLPAPNCEHTGMFQRLESENRLVEMGIYRVMFGYRVRAGFVGSCGVMLDWCGGDDWKNVERLYAVCKSILSQRDENRECFEGLPGHSNIKPFYLDEAFTQVILRACGKIQLELLPLPPPFSWK